MEAEAPARKLREHRHHFIIEQKFVFTLRHAVPSRERASLRTDARAAGSPDALLHRGHSGQKRVHVQPSDAGTDSTVSELFFHESDSLLSDPDL